MTARQSGTTIVTVDEIEALAAKALQSSHVSPANAASVARSIAYAERDGQQIVGLSYLPTYCDHAACGKVDGFAVPELATATLGGGVRVDAKTGFAHPAIELGLAPLIEAVRRQGIAALSVGNSYACGSLGYFVETLAEQGLVALMAANASPSIAVHGGKAPFFGTNPLAFAIPRQSGAPLVIDQSSSVVARVAVNDALRRGAPMPPGWALDADGQPTTDPAEAINGSLLPIGGYKGAGLALFVDILAGALTGSNFSFEASSFGDCNGGPPRTGQFLIAIDPALFGGTGFTARVEMLFAAMLSEPGTRLPGDRRLAARKAHADGVAVDNALLALIKHYAHHGSPVATASHDKG